MIRAIVGNLVDLLLCQRSPLFPLPDLDILVIRPHVGEPLFFPQTRNDQVAKQSFSVSNHPKSWWIHEDRVPLRPACLINTGPVILYNATTATRSQQGSKAMNKIAARLNTHFITLGQWF